MKIAVAGKGIGRGSSRGGNSYHTTERALQRWIDLIHTFANRLLNLGLVFHQRAGGYKLSLHENFVSDATQREAVTGVAEVVGGRGLIKLLPHGTVYQFRGGVAQVRLDCI